MKHLIPQTMTAVSVLALALAVGGCGSSSDDDVMAAPTPEEMRQAKMMECTDTGGRYETDGSCTTVDELIAEGAATAAETVCEDAGGRYETDGSCTDAVTVMAEQQAADEMTCTDAGGRYEADGSCTDAADLMAEAAATKAAGTKATAIATEASQPDDDGLGGADANHMLAITRDADGTEVMITVDGAVMGEPKFEEVMDLGGGSTMHVRAMDADDDGNVVEEVVIVSTDIEAPKAVAFAEFESMDGMTPQELGVSTDMTNDDPAVTFEALAVVESAAALVMSSAFAAGTAATLTFGGDDPNDDMDEAFEAAGTYNGAMGTYKCNGGANECTVTLDAMGMITGMGTGWIFTPDPGATSDQPNYDYLNYGFWLKRTTDADGVLTYNEVETFAGSSVVPSGNVGLVTGKADYEGGATGVYVRNVSTAGGSHSATSGHFTADASLTVYFGQVNDAEGDGTIAPNLLNALTGTVDKFMLAGEEENKWSVALKGDIVEGDGTASGSANGGGAAGTFSATFHGSVVEVGSVVPQPGSVVGEFNANFSNGSVAGGFGARKQ